MKKVNYILSVLTIAVALTAGFTACSNEDNSVDGDGQFPFQTNVFHVSIPATLGSTTRGVEFSGDSYVRSIFMDGEKVLVYNETLNAFACEYDDDEEEYVPIALNPTDISADGKHCTLTGDLKFYKYDDLHDFYPVTPGASDTYSLYYQMTRADTEEPTSSYFSFDLQFGSTADVSLRDFAMAKGVTLTRIGNTLNANNVDFQVIQSTFFHLNFILKDETGAEVNSNISSLEIYSENETLVYQYYPVSDNFYRDWILFPHVDGNELYTMLRFNYDEDHPAASDMLTFVAFDAEDIKYVGTMSCPTDGFKFGEYYQSSVTLQAEPLTVIDDDTSSPVTKTGDTFILEDGHNYTVSGTGKGNIVGSGEIVLKLADYTQIRGCVNLQSVSGKTAKITTNEYCKIINPGAIALQGNTGYKTIVDINMDLIINGNTSGDFEMTQSSYVIVEGDISDGAYYLNKWAILMVNGSIGGTITAAFDENGKMDSDITNNYDEYEDYKIFISTSPPNPVFNMETFYKISVNEPLSFDVSASVEGGDISTIEMTYNDFSSGFTWDAESGHFEVTPETPGDYCIEFNATSSFGTESTIMVVVIVNE